MRRVRLNGLTLGFIGVFVKEMKGRGVGKVERVAEEKVVALIGRKGSFG